MSVRASSWAWEHSAASGAALLVLLALADHAGHDGGDAYPSVATLARRCRVDERTVRRCLRELEELGEVVTEANAGRAGTNRYRVTFTTTGRPSRPVDNPVDNLGITGGGITPGGASTTVRGGTTPPEPSVNRPKDPPTPLSAPTAAEPTLTPQGAAPPGTPRSPATPPTTPRATGTNPRALEALQAEARALEAEAVQAATFVHACPDAFPEARHVIAATLVAWAQDWQAEHPRPATPDRHRHGHLTRYLEARAENRSSPVDATHRNGTATVQGPPASSDDAREARDG